MLFFHLQTGVIHCLSSSVIQYLLLRIWNINLSWYGYFNWTPNNEFMLYLFFSIVFRSYILPKWRHLYITKHLCMLSWMEWCQVYNRYHYYSEQIAVFHTFHHFFISFFYYCKSHDNTESKQERVWLCESKVSKHVTFGLGTFVPAYLVNVYSIPAKCLALLQCYVHTNHTKLQVVDYSWSELGIYLYKILNPLSVWDLVIKYKHGCFNWVTVQAFCANNRCM